MFENGAITQVRIYGMPSDAVTSFNEPYTHITKGIEEGSMFVRWILCENILDFRSINSTLFEITINGIEDVTGKTICVFQSESDDDNAALDGYIVWGKITSCEKTDLYGLGYKLTVYIGIDNLKYIPATDVLFKLADEFTLEDVITTALDLAGFKHPRFDKSLLTSQLVYTQDWVSHINWDNVSAYDLVSHACEILCAYITFETEYNCYIRSLSIPENPETNNTVINISENIDKNTLTIGTITTANLDTVTAVTQGITLNADDVYENISGRVSYKSSATTVYEYVIDDNIFLRYWSHFGTGTIGPDYERFSTASILEYIHSKVNNYIKYTPFTVDILNYFNSLVKIGDLIRIDILDLSNNIVKSVFSPVLQNERSGNLLLNQRLSSSQIELPQKDTTDTTQSDLCEAVSQLSQNSKDTNEKVTDLQSVLSEAVGTVANKVENRTSIYETGYDNRKLSDQTPSTTQQEYTWTLKPGINRITISWRYGTAVYLANCRSASNVDLFLTHTSTSGQAVSINTDGTGKISTISSLYIPKLKPIKYSNYILNFYSDTEHATKTTSSSTKPVMVYLTLENKDNFSG